MGPPSTTRPPYITYTKSQCADHPHVMRYQQQGHAKRSHKLRKSVEYAGLDRDVSALVGSSATRSCGRHTIAIAINARCIMPPDSWCG